MKWTGTIGTTGTFNNNTHGKEHNMGILKKLGFIAPHAFTKGK